MKSGVESQVFWSSMAIFAEVILFHPPPSLAAARHSLPFPKVLPRS